VFSFGSNRALGFGFGFEQDPTRVFRDQFSKPIGPLDNRNAVSKEIFIEPESFDCFAFFDSKKIEMINWHRAVGIFMNERKRRTRNHGITAHSGAQTFDELRFAATKLTRERQHIAPLQVSGKPPTERFRFLHAIGNECSHASKDEG